jgi:hypothetical protein
MRYTILFLYVLVSLLAASSNDRWDAVTPIKTVKKMSVYKNDIYGITDGGVIRLNGDEEPVYISPADGIDGTALLDISANGKSLFVISDNFALSYTDGSSWQTAERVEIDAWQHLFAEDNNIWISYDDGVIVYSAEGEEWSFRDFFNRFPVSPPGGNIIPVVFNGKIFLFFGNGFLRADADYMSVNLKNSDNWEFQTLFSPGEEIDNYVIHNGEIIFATNLNVYRFTSADVLEAISAGLNGAGNVPLFSNGTELYAMSGGKIYLRNGGGWLEKYDTRGTYSGFAVSGNDIFLSGVSSDMVRYNIPDDSFDSIFLNRPGGIRFRQFARDKNGNFYAATTGLYGAPPSIAAFNYEGIWYNLKAADSHFNHYYYGSAITSVVISDAGEIIWATYGRGIYIQKGKEDFTLINRSGDRTATLTLNDKALYIQNSGDYKDYFGYVSTSTDTTFTIVQDMVKDSRGNIWLTNHQANTFNGLICVKPENDGSFSLNRENWLYWDMRKPFTSSLYLTTIGVVHADIFDRIWIGTKLEGAAVLDYKGTLENQNDDVWETVAVKDGLASSRVQAINSDLNGTVYLGTDNGLNMVSGSTIYLLKGDYAPRGMRINDIERDSKGNMWFATDAGISILLADKNAFEPESWIHYNTENSGLLDNFCNGLFIDEDNRKVYIGTDKGISVLITPYLENSSGAEPTLTLGPNPFHFGKGNIIISGINPTASLKILTPNGNLVRLFNPEEMISGTVSWNGTKSSGTPLATGVYILVAVNEDGKIQTAKLMYFR